MPSEVSTQVEGEGHFLNSIAPSRPYAKIMWMLMIVRISIGACHGPVRVFPLLRPNIGSAIVLSVSDWDA